MSIVGTVLLETIGGGDQVDLLRELHLGDNSQGEPCLIHDVNSSSHSSCKYLLSVAMLPTKKKRKKGIRK
jgi:hypothetical protein